MLHSLDLCLHTPDVCGSREVFWAGRARSDAHLQIVTLRWGPIRGFQQSPFDHTLLTTLRAGPPGNVPLPGTSHVGRVGRPRETDPQPNPVPQSTTRKTGGVAVDKKMALARTVNPSRMSDQ